VITAAWLPLEQCAPVLDKIIGCRLGSKLFVTLAKSLIQCGIFSLKCFHLSREHPGLLADES
jgi:hypothetical protein